MNILLEIKPCVGLSALSFGATTAETEQFFGKADEQGLLDDEDDSKTTVWHYWMNGFSLFFEDDEIQLFNCVEIDNVDTELWGQKIFGLKEKQIIELFKTKGITKYDTEFHPWGEKCISFDDAHIDFYFEKNKLVSINYCKPLEGSHTLILPN